jgi:hypothetical protein
VSVRLKNNLLVITAETLEAYAMMAVWAKASDGHVFAQHQQDRCTFRLTRHDSHTIPGVVMADIWMRLRRTVAHGDSEAETADNGA